MSFVVLLVLFGVMYAVLIVPQQRRMKAHREMLARLKPGDLVVTSGGIHGAVVEVEDAVVWLEVAPDVELKVNKAAVADIVEPADDDFADDDFADDHDDDHDDDDHDGAGIGSDGGDD